MPSYAYKVMPAPTKGLKAKGVKGAEARFSHAIETLMNTLAAEGWEYLRADTLPSVERSGLTSTTTEWRTLLVFRKLQETETETVTPELLPPPRAEDLRPAERPEPPLSAPPPSGRLPEEPTREHAPRAFTNPPEPRTQDWRSMRSASEEDESISDKLEKFASTRSSLNADS